MMNATDLLDAYRERRSDEAFAELVRRYTNLVYSVALRRLGSSALAEEVGQEVFTQLARAVPRLGSDAKLVAWLHRTTVHVSIDVWRSETRRRAREEKATTMEPASSDTDSLWNELAPQLDDALNRLNGSDRQALLLRYFDSKRMRDLGRILGVTEDAAKMRVNRALDRLRSQLEARGVTCPTVTLAMLLGSRVLEAAPDPLVVSLSAARYSVPAGASGLSGILEAILHTSKDKLIAAGLVVVTMAVSVNVWLRSNRDLAAVEPDVYQTLISTTDGTSDRTDPIAQRVPSLMGTRDRAVPIAVRQLVRVVDAESGRGLAGVAIRAVYFYAGGRGEPHELVTDPSGYAAIPEALEPNDRGMNVFATIEGYVPKSVGGLVGSPPPADYVIRLEPARRLSGTVVTERGWPVADVAIRAQTADDYQAGADNITFQLAMARTDADGRWAYPYIPKHYEEVRLILTHDDYAVTLPNVPIDQVDPLNLVLVIDSGFTVTGQITDPQGSPVAGASVRELVNTGYRRLSTTTDDDGRFILKGVWTHDNSRTRPMETNADGTIRLRGLAGIGQPKVNLVVQADWFAPETRTVDLLEPTTTQDFRLRAGQIFRGRILDESGKPIPNAVVRTDTDNQGIRKFDWTGRTDADGRFQWTSAPPEPVLFWFEAEGGYEWLRDVPLVPDGTDYQITLKRALR